MNRKHFWIPAHTAFELAIITTLVVTWSEPTVRFWLLVALASHVALRVWSAVDFIPKALAFEKGGSAIPVKDALRWTRRSLARLPLAVVTTLGTLTAFATACGLQP